MANEKGIVETSGKLLDAYMRLWGSQIVWAAEFQRAATDYLAGLGQQFIEAYRYVVDNFPVDEYSRLVEVMVHDLWRQGVEREQGMGPSPDLRRSAERHVHELFLAMATTAAKLPWQSTKNLLDYVRIGMEQFPHEAYARSIKELADAYARSAGDSGEKTLNFWLAAEDTMRDITAAILKMLAASARHLNAAVIELIDSSLVRDYVEQVIRFSMGLGKEADIPAGCRPPLEFWLAAERHVRAILRMNLAAAGTSARSAEDALESALERLRGYSIEPHLKRIRELAYLFWERAGKPMWRSLDYWLEAEREILRRIVAEAESGQDLRSPARDRGGEGPSSHIVGLPPIQG